MDGLAKIEADSDPYDVIIVDQEMPCLTGVEFVREIRKPLSPGTGDIHEINTHTISKRRTLLRSL